MNTFENVSGYFHNSLNASITASKANMVFAYFILTFAVILCKCNMCSYIILGLAVSELLMVDIYKGSIDGFICRGRSFSS